MLPNIIIIKDNENIQEFIITTKNQIVFRNPEQIDKIKQAIDLYLEPNLNFTFIRKTVLERTNRGKLKQFKSFL